MGSRSTDASIAFSVTDNLSQSIVRMRNSVNSFRSDAEGLQQRLTTLENTRLQLKNIDLKRAKDQVEQARKALEDLGDAATDAEREAAQADFNQAIQHYANVEGQLQLVSKQARQTQRDLLDATGAISKAENRAGGLTGSGSSVLSALGKAGLGQMAGSAAQEVANTLIGSMFGSSAGGVLSSGLSGAISGAAMGSMIAPGVGTAVGAAIGGGIGLLQGATQVYGERDEAFKAYYQGLYEAGKTESEESLTSGSSTAAQRELDAIAFNKLLYGQGDEFLEGLRKTAAETPFEYSDLTTMARSLATGFGSDPDRMLELMTAIGDAGAAVGASSSDMQWMATALSRMQSTDLAQLGEINMFQDRGVDVIGMLADAYGKSEGDIRSMITKGEIGGRDAVSLIQAALTDPNGVYAGSMELMAGTFEGLTSTLQDAMTEIDAARGEGYNEERKAGLQAEIDAYGGALGEAMQELNQVAGQNEAYLENLGEQFKREALSAVLLGEDTTLFSGAQQEELQAMRDEYRAASEAYAEGNQEAGLKMESLAREAEALATSAYESSEQYQAVVDTELDLIDAIRANTSVMTSYLNEYSIQQELTKGGAAGGMAAWLDSDSGSNGVWYMGAWRDPMTLEPIDNAASHAGGLNRVPYDNYAALLHEGERVLTAREAREMDRGGQGGGVTVHITGEWHVNGPEDADAVAEAILRKVKLAQTAGTR